MVFGMGERVTEREALKYWVFRYYSDSGTV